MWISLRSRVPFAVQVYVGGVNAISGEPVGEDEATLMRRLTLMEKKESIQDYVVTPKQLWLDGIATGNGRVRQFVAMPLGSGYSVEAQVTGQDLHGGLQFHVTASTPKPLAREPLYYKYSPLTESVIAALKKPKSPDFDDSPIQIKVMFCSGKECDFLVLPSDLIAELKLQLLSREGIPYSELRLTLEWKMLDDRKSQNLMVLMKSDADVLRPLSRGLQHPKSQ